MTQFTDPARVANYAEETPSRVPGLMDLHRMAVILLSERAKNKARILVLGAGGGLELRSFSAARPDWSFVGVDPSRAMLDLAQSVIGDLGSRTALIKRDTSDVPRWNFDG